MSIEQLKQFFEKRNSADKPNIKTIQYAEYILNHYSRHSYADKLALAKDLENHGWRSKI